MRQQRLMLAAVKEAAGPAAMMALARKYGLVDDAIPSQGELLALPAPAEPPFCTGCAARRMWEKPHPTYAKNGLDPAEYHPLSDGPITGNELAILVLLREQKRAREGLPA